MHVNKLKSKTFLFSLLVLTTFRPFFLLPGHERKQFSSIQHFREHGAPEANPGLNGVNVVSG